MLGFFVKSIHIDLRICTWKFSPPGFLGFRKRNRQFITINPLRFGNLGNVSVVYILSSISITVVMLIWKKIGLPRRDHFKSIWENTRVNDPILAIFLDVARDLLNQEFCPPTNLLTTMKKKRNVNCVENYLGKNSICNYTWNAMKEPKSFSASNALSLSLQKVILIGIVWLTQVITPTTTYNNPTIFSL